MLASEWIMIALLTQRERIRNERGAPRFRYFAVVIRHLISRPQRTPKSSRNVTAKVWETAKAPQRLRRLIPRWSDSRSLSKCYRWRRAFPLAFISGLTGAWQMITYQKVLSLCKFYRIREAIIGENKVFHRLKSLIYRERAFLWITHPEL